MNWQDAGRYGRLCREITNETGSRAICHVWTRQNSRHKTKDGTEPWPEGEANLRLILKAPVMLEALEAIAAVKHPQWCDFGAMTKAYSQRGEIARTAIAAVKGEGNDEDELV